MGTELIAFDRRGLSVSEVFDDITHLTSSLIVQNLSNRFVFNFHIEDENGDIAETVAVGTNTGRRPQVIQVGKIRGLNRAGTFDLFDGKTVRTMGVWGYRIEIQAVR